MIFNSYKLQDIPSSFVLEKSFRFLTFCGDFLIPSIVTIRNSALWGDVVKSLPRHTSRCGGTESQASLEIGFRPCAELQILSSYRGWKEACHATRAISTISRRDLSSSFYPASQNAEENSHYSDRNIRGTCSILRHRQNWMVQFKRGEFSTCDASRLGRPKTVTSPEIIDKIH